MRRRPNLLLLDEPTNHLDIEMREALAEALQDYGGALVVVAHDRHLLRATTDALWLVDRGAIAPFDGDLDDYRNWVLDAARRASAASPRAADDVAGVDRRTQRRADAQARQRAYAKKRPLTERRAEVEAEMEALAAEKKDLDEWLAQQDAYVDDNRATLPLQLTRQADVTWRLARLETEWLEIAEAIDRLDTES